MNYITIKFFKKVIRAKKNSMIKETGLPRTSLPSYPQHYIMKTFKHAAKLKGFYSKTHVVTIYNLPLMFYSFIMSMFIHLVFKACQSVCSFQSGG